MYDCTYLLYAIVLFLESLLWVLVALLFLLIDHLLKFHHIICLTYI